MPIRVLLVLVFAAWMAGWFWAFSFAFSDGFFRYHLDTRIPFLLLSLLAVAVPPVSGYLVVRGLRRGTLSPPGACLAHLLATLAPLALFLGVYQGWRLLARLLGRHAFEADEAMGIGIDFSLCTAVVLVANLALWLAIALLPGLRRPARTR